MATIHGERNQGFHRLPETKDGRAIAELFRADSEGDGSAVRSALQTLIDNGAVHEIGVPPDTTVYATYPEDRS